MSINLSSTTRKNLITTGITFALSLLSCSANAEQAITINDVYVRAMPPTAQNTAGYMQIHNHSKQPVSLIKAESPLAKNVELHLSKMDEGVMKMIQQKVIMIPAEGSTHLKPGGLHIMFLGLKKPSNEGSKTTLKLTFSNGDQLTVDAPIMKTPNPRGDMKHVQN
ncbi:copper chaperone PCu(A)C [Zooshikella harenae]|uniref:Copper chaperone PCu(A)C n=1 Tax=Zooshikella harenae TaxID=2827238 RepID=A0ABS5ZD94_9GAMM|nr:copper chaperone PCu(A)C [Zooshikella harenae]MBU2711240.1 copper chaperone PCu(A)C [Zooshikella harenae]